MRSNVVSSTYQLPGDLARTIISVNCINCRVNSIGWMVLTVANHWCTIYIEALISIFLPFIELCKKKITRVPRKTCNPCFLIWYYFVRIDSLSINILIVTYVGQSDHLIKSFAIHLSIVLLSTVLVAFSFLATN